MKLVYNAVKRLGREDRFSERLGENMKESISNFEQAADDYEISPN